jgi:isopenicillin-N epimerase
MMNGVENIPLPSGYAKFWILDTATVFLNHGSFGACPRVILDRQTDYRQRLEARPVQFLMREMEGMLDRSRREVAEFVHAAPEDLVFVQNSTTAVNTVFRSLKLNPGDEILFTSHIYGACRRLLEYISREAGVELIEAAFDFPTASEEMILDAILEKVTPRTRIALIDHISSATALIHPVETIVKELDRRGVDTLIDGAHALGSIPLDLKNIGAAYYTANCHKWLCTPKSAAILHVRSDKQKGVVPVVISHAGHEAEPFAERFFWPGTYDPTAALCVSDAIGYIGSMVPGGWPAVMKHNHDLCVEARELICRMLKISMPCPDRMIASMATFCLPPQAGAVPVDYKSFSPLQEILFRKYKIEIPIWNWPSPPSRLVRISAQLYNSLSQYEYLATALSDTLKNLPG